MIVCVPGAANTWEAVTAVLVQPSPAYQRREVIVPVLVSVSTNAVTPAIPVPGVTVKLATGDAGSTSMLRLAEAQPPALHACSETVWLPAAAKAWEALAPVAVQPSSADQARLVMVPVLVLVSATAWPTDAGFGLAVKAGPGGAGSTVIVLLADPQPLTLQTRTDRTWLPTVAKAWLGLVNVFAVWTNAVLVQPSSADQVTLVTVPVIVVCDDEWLSDHDGECAGGEGGGRREQDGAIRAGRRCAAGRQQDARECHRQGQQHGQHRNQGGGRTRWAGTAWRVAAGALGHLDRAPGRRGAGAGDARLLLHGAAPCRSFAGR